MVTDWHAVRWILIVSIGYLLPVTPLFDEYGSQNLFLKKFDIYLSAKTVKVVFELYYDDAIPKTAQNFLEFATGELSYGYENSHFHLVIPQFML